MHQTLRLSALLLLLLAGLAAFRAATPEFEGRIIYQYSFTDLQGNDISARMTPFFGQQQRYYVKGGMYKAYNERDEWMQLYEPGPNLYHYFSGGKVAQTFKAGDAAGPAKTTALPTPETILGRRCQGVQIEADGATTSYFYSPEVRVNPALYRQHNFGHWNTLLDASQGALPLLFTSVNPKQGFIMKAVAIEITPMKLKAEDFVLPAGAK
ncbi:hypothetical protein EJV47_04965 [Hymenobacter gummosus]|uniref:DUF4412 domain-containing protein n=1 Tax=Hymenobacter gummosus TaxID=1776032 RepID=A0A3S0HQM1_9BACT|nr:hypothetical protein [Hymenobacter gummosus]RTQ52369.1 hypothetical protein EJV47_04965 [Hymenobacter gummosus]